MATRSIAEINSSIYAATGFVSGGLPDDYQIKTTKSDFKALARALGVNTHALSGNRPYKTVKARELVAIYNDNSLAPTINQWYEDNQRNDEPTPAQPEPAKTEKAIWPNIELKEMFAALLETTGDYNELLAEIASNFNDNTISDSEYSELLKMASEYNRDGATPTPQKKEAPTMPAVETNNAQINALQALLATMKPEGAELDENRVIKLIHDHAPKAPVIKIDLTKKNGEKVEVEGLQHEVFEDVLLAVSCKLNVLVVGPAGSGKTTMAEMVAKSLDVPFYFNGAIASEYKLTGFIDAHGKVINTQFREAYENGGLYLFDEIDGSLPGALLAFNAALSNGYADFPDGRINKHEDFYCLAAANTYGHGASRQYVGRNQLDAASIDRFCVFDMNYDERLETSISPNPAWTQKIQNYRKAAADLNIRHIISPRASISGAKLLANGMAEHKVENAVIWKGLAKDDITKIKNHA